MAKAGVKAAGGGRNARSGRAARPAAGEASGRVVARPQPVRR